MRKILFTPAVTATHFFDTVTAAMQNSELIFNRRSADWRRTHSPSPVRGVIVATREELAALPAIDSTASVARPVLEWARSKRFQVRVHVAQYDGLFTHHLVGFWQFGKLVALHASGERSGTKQAPRFHVASLRPSLKGTDIVHVLPVEDCPLALGRASYLIHGFMPEERQQDAPTVNDLDGLPFKEEDVRPDAPHTQDHHLLHGALNRVTPRLRVITRHDGITRLLLDDTEVGTVTISDEANLKGGRAVTLHLPSGLTPYLGTVKGNEMEVFRPEELCLGLRIITRENFGPYAARMIWTIRHHPQTLDLHTTEFPCWISARGLGGYVEGQHAQLTPTANGRVALRFARMDNVHAVAGPRGVARLYADGNWRTVA